MQDRVAAGAVHAEVDLVVYGGVAHVEPEHDERGGGQHETRGTIGRTWASVDVAPRPTVGHDPEPYDGAGNRVGTAALWHAERVDDAPSDLRIDDLRTPRLSVAQRSVLEYEKQLVVSLAEDDLFDRARAVSGLDDFGDDGFRPRLRRLPGRDRSRLRAQQPVPAHSTAARRPAPLESARA